MDGLQGVVMKAFASIAVVTGASAFSPDFTVEYIGVPFNVLIACALGAYSGFSFGDRIESRGRMFQLFTACVIMGCAWTGVVNAAVIHFTDWEPTRGALAGMGAVIACMSRFFIPELIKRIGPWLDKIPFLSPRKGE